MNEEKIKEIKNKVAMFFGFSPEKVDQWWNEKHPFLDGKSPKEAVLTSNGFKKLKILVGFSTSEK